jgi:pimeloyl-ACP methyl ester carboxylesterase
MSGASLPYSTAGFRRDERLVDGVRTVVYSAGQGPPVVYLHGGGSWHGFEWARDWLDRFHVILPYHPGYGESADDPDVCSIDDLVAHYTRLFEMLGLQRFHLVGASLGGWLAARIALTLSGRVERLVLVAPSGLLVAAHPAPDFAGVPSAELPGLFASDPAFVARFWPAQPDARLTGLLAREAATTARLMQELPVADRKLRRRLPRLAVPTLVLWGERDRVLSAELAREWMRVLPDARAQIVAGGGHLLLDEFPQARAAAAQFLEGTFSSPFSERPSRSLRTAARSPGRRLR